MAEKFLWGVETVELGTPGVNGAAPTGWVRFEDITDDSVSLTIPEQTTNDIRVEDKPGIRLSLPSDTEAATLNLGTINAEGSKIATVSGGSYVEVDDEFTPPADTVIVEKAVRLTTKPLKGKKAQFTFFLTSLAYNFSGNFTRSGVVSMGVIAKILTPTDANGVALPPWKLKYLNAGGSIPTSWDTTLTFASSGNASGGGISAATSGGADPDKAFKFNVINPHVGLPKDMEIFIASSNVGTISFTAEYAGEYFSFTAADGIEYYGIFAEGDVVLTVMPESE
ncbi:hypothetical protein [Hufsiella ginkgonis]|uniref:Phage tail protein n=1 Tax=Hufsiella ginkgonis TaxID=2695274 RepID=A0A7K1Y0S8_9SPHI|nr:hypothetical protein [Hufsiella ginkgonis]MXV16831.1 hypothetical protein [Hufsiella ginkgonis]